MLSSLMFPDGALDLLHDHLRHRRHHHDLDHDQRDKLRAALISSGGGAGGSYPSVDILGTPKEYIFHFDVPGLSKTDIQVNVIEEENADRSRAAGQILVVENPGSGGVKRKREGDESKGGADLENEKNGHGHEEVKGGSASSCKYIRLERRVYPKKFMRKFRLPEKSNVSAISAKCENGVLTVKVEKKLPHPPAKPNVKTVEITSGN
ncbi:hypothetical protein MKW98_012806 [Papaver atlanticum]|uniref:SHSP domain-containing protein n=1 Tax=Papaver atlanticum TaxID=357466 RepID=A0AAD4SL74_9MAGN|nr:hypothetical protein MKW98_012806 [Papaver atlanticum]